MPDGYCVKCKDKVQYEGVQRVILGGRVVIEGKCPQCGLTIQRVTKRNEYN